MEGANFSYNYEAEQVRAVEAQPNPNLVAEAVNLETNKMSFAAVSDGSALTAATAQKFLPEFPQMIELQWADRGNGILKRLGLEMVDAQTGRSSIDYFTATDLLKPGGRFWEGVHGYRTFNPDGSVEVESRDRTLQMRLDSSGRVVSYFFLKNR